MHFAARLIVLTGAALVGAFIGYLSELKHLARRDYDRYPHLATYRPLPHHVPRLRNDISFRFAMVHDVLHERYPKHGPAYHRRRELLTREKLARLPPDDEATFPLIDDLAIAVHRLGRHDEAIALMREKMQRQAAKKQFGAELYTSHSNLGAILLHAEEVRWLAGDPAARVRFAEGVTLVRQSVVIYPQAHFGRQRWHAVLGEFLLAAMRDPRLATTFDFLGNSLDRRIEDTLQREMTQMDTEYGRPNALGFRPDRARIEVPQFFHPNVDPADPVMWPDLVAIRKYITKVGAEYDWKPLHSHGEPVAFDEPCLAIVGMWRQSGAASPHMALALAETMLRVGQRYIAWAAFERTARLADRVSPEPSVVKSLREHCRKRQEQIETTLRFSKSKPEYEDRWHRVSPPPPAEVVDGLRAQFDAELAHGERYQRAYQEYEASRIASGVSIDDPHFMEPFLALHPPIASSSGPEEWYASVDPADFDRQLSNDSMARSLLGAGIAALAAALVMRVRAWWRTLQAIFSLAAAMTCCL